MTNALLRLTDGSTTISLIKGKGESGFHLDGWTPQIADYKEGGIWRDSPLASSRRLAYKRWASAIENINLKANDLNQDALIEETQEIRRLLEKASDYWTTNWQDEPVWIEAQAPCETGTRYALVLRGRIPEDDNPFEQPFLQEKGAVLDNLVLNLERGHWLGTAPGQPCADERYETGCFPYYLEFDGANSVVDCGSDPTIDDIPAGGQFTADMWARPTSYGEGNTGYFIRKGSGWAVWFTGGNIVFRVYAGGGNSTAQVAYTVDSQWHHYAFTYDDTGARTAEIWEDGVSIAVGGAAGGVYTPDAASNLFIGASNAAAANVFRGDIGWTRVSDSIRWAAAFSPPPRCVVPAPDANSVMIVIFDGESPTTYDLTINGNDGAITSATWDCDCDYSVQVD